jgi:hypothetical protein
MGSDRLFKLFFSPFLLSVPFFWNRSNTIMGALMKRPPIKRPRAIQPAWNVHPTNGPLWCYTTVTLLPCNVLLMPYFTPNWTDCLSTLKSDEIMDDLWQRETTHGNFGQSMTVTICPILILIYVAFFASKETLAWISVLEGTAAQGFLALVGL